MICKKCGNEMPDDVKVCTNCGNPLENEAQNTIIQNLSSLDKEMNLFNKPFTYEQVFVLAAGVLVILSSFLPYVSVSLFGISSSINVLQMNAGFIFIIPAILTIIFMYMKKELLAMILSLVGLALLLMLFFYEMGVISDYGFGSLSIGAYLTLLGSIAMFAFSLHRVMKNKKAKQN